MILLSMIADLYTKSGEEKMDTVYLVENEEYGHYKWIPTNLPNEKELEKRGITIGNQVTLGDNVRLHNNCRIEDFATIGNNVTIGEGAIIKHSVHIHDMIFIGHRSVIGEKSFIGARSRIGPDCVIENNVFIGLCVTIARHCYIQKYARIKPCCWIGSEADIGINARITSNSIIGTKGKIESYRFPITININGTRHNVSYWGEDRIDIGCIEKPIKWWMENYKKAGIAHDYTEDEQEEYYTYIKMIRDIHNQ